MTFADIKGNVIAHLTGNFEKTNVIRGQPAILDGEKETNVDGKTVKYKSYIKIYDDGLDIEYVDPQRTVIDEYYGVRLEIGSHESYDNRNEILAECQRIIGLTGITGYDNQRITEVKNRDNSMGYYTDFKFVAIKYNQNL